MTTPILFISYSRRNRDFAKDLYARLDALGFSLWRDVHDIEAGADDWWEAIQEAIRGCHTMILCMSLPALKSPVVSDEWLYARTLGKRIIPVVADAIWEHPEVVSGAFTIPNWMQRRNWIDYRDGQPEAEAAWDNLISTLRRDYEPKPFVSMVPELPPRFVRRPDLTDRIIRALVDDNHDVIAMTTALRGAGGYGKTTLAKAVARDVRVQGAFDDGILWVTLGEDLLERRGDALTNALIARAQELIDALTTERPLINTLEKARAELNKAIGDRYILLVIDDVWDEAHLRPFLLETTHSACIITTRNADTVNRPDIQQQPVDRMLPLEAVELLSAGFPPEDAGPLATAFDAFARDLRAYPLLLALANSTIANWKDDLGIPLHEALALARETFAEQGILGFDDQDTQDRTRAVDRTLAVSLGQLKPDERRRYLELATFREDASIPLTTLALYWGMSKVQALQFCSKLYRKTALLQSLEGGAIRIHDVFRDYLLRQHPANELRVLHARLIDAYGDLTTLPDDYAWRNFAYHLREADKLDTLRALLLDYRFLGAKLDATEVNALITDCDTLPGDEAIRLLKSALSMSAHVLNEDKDQLPYQITGRLWTHRDQHDIAPLWRTCHTVTPLELLETQAFPPMLQAGGALIRTLEGHKGMVSGALALIDGCFVSWSVDGTLRLWDGSGHALAIHVGEVTGALALADGRFLSWSADDTLHLWDGAGRALATLEGHTGSVVGVLALPDGRFLSWSADDTLRLWDRAGRALAVLEEHADNIEGALALGDGRFLSWSFDGTLRLWNGAGRELVVLQGHTNRVHGALELADGRFLSWSFDDTLRLWDGAGHALAILEGHTNGVHGALELADGRLLSWSADGTLRLWDETGRALAVLAGHNGEVTGALALADGRFLSWSADDTLHLWDGAGRALAVLKGHTDNIEGALALADGRFLSWSFDDTLRLWDGAGHALAILEGHTNGVHGALELADGRFLSWSFDGTLRLWDGVGNVPAILAGHTSLVYGALALADGRFLSWSFDGTLRLWDETGRALAILVGHTNSVWGVLELVDGRFISWGLDDTLRLWDGSGRTLAVLDDWKADEARLSAWAVAQSFDLRVLYKGEMDKRNSAFARPDGKRLFVHGAGQFISDANIGGGIVRDNLIVVGDSAGRVIFLRWRGGE